MTGLVRRALARHRMRRQANEVLRDVVDGTERMLMRWADASPEVRRRDLWQPLMQAHERARDVLDAGGTP